MVQQVRFWINAFPSFFSTENPSQQERWVGSRCSASATWWHAHHAAGVDGRRWLLGQDGQQATPSMVAIHTGNQSTSCQDSIHHCGWNFNQQWNIVTSTKQKPFLDLSRRFSLFWIWKILLFGTNSVPRFESQLQRDNRPLVAPKKWLWPPVTMTGRMAMPWCWDGNEHCPWRTGNMSSAIARAQNVRNASRNGSERTSVGRSFPSWWSLAL